MKPRPPGPVTECSGRDAYVVPEELENSPKNGKNPEKWSKASSLQWKRRLGGACRGSSAAVPPSRSGRRLLRRDLAVCLLSLSAALRLDSCKPDSDASSLCGGSYSVTSSELNREDRPFAPSLSPPFFNLPPLEASAVSLPDTTASRSPRFSASSQLASTLSSVSSLAPPPAAAPLSHSNAVPATLRLQAVSSPPLPSVAASSSAPEPASRPRGLQEQPLMAGWDSSLPRAGRQRSSPSAESGFSSTRSVGSPARQPPFSRFRTQAVVPAMLFPGEQSRERKPKTSASSDPSEPRQGAASAEEFAGLSENKDARRRVQANALSRPPDQPAAGVSSASAQVQNPSTLSSVQGALAHLREDNAWLAAPRDRAAGAVGAEKDVLCGVFPAEEFHEERTLEVRGERFEDRGSKQRASTAEPAEALDDSPRGAESRTRIELHSAPDTRETKVAEASTEANGGGTRRKKWRLFSWMSEVLLRARLEQQVEDLNILLRQQGSSDRLYLVLPLSEYQNPPADNFSHGHIMEGDKVSFPREVLTLLLDRKWDAPWQFLLEKVYGPHDEEALATIAEHLRRAAEKVLEGGLSDLSVATAEAGRATGAKEGRQEPNSEKQGAGRGRRRPRRVAVSPLDFSAPRNFIFLPLWVMKTLNLRPLSIVACKWIRLPLAAHVTLQPASSEFYRAVKRTGKDVQKILEEELRHYSSLTADTRVPIKLEGQTFWLHVRDVQAESSGKAEVDHSEHVCVQDSDVATSLVPAADEAEMRNGNVDRDGTSRSQD
ncbi:ubiquitin fusion degradation protein UFD1AP [Besnoitia besnoiti]|uniref:Ubiquitin fusion degradation protein UFD1AP n=1 Tax=Besnoitia besnoiti TaxID=94643 RepID=A0A2A9MGY0_BESBE|nr:ubiquitin fusion degradation protein UFD1AP [Besnoitia besnoiti]PFH34847.1 ubiquitin fusion degradation protein UFD1AP [Besnoitia besnoiti]